MNDMESERVPARSDVQVEWAQLKLKMDEWISRSGETDYSAFLREADRLLAEVPQADRELARTHLEELKARFQPRLEL